MLLDALSAAAAPAGGAAGGLLGQVGDTLSAPRRALMRVLGMPESGTELLHQTFGMDSDSLLTKALGVGAEMALDPLTYAGIPLGGALGKVAGHLSGGEAALAKEIESLQALKGPLAERVAEYGTDVAGNVAEDRAGALARELAREPGLAQLDVPGIADAAGREYRQVNPDVRGVFEGHGLGVDTHAAGQGLPAPGSTEDYGPFRFHGRELPPGTQLDHYHDPATGRLRGRAVNPADAEPKSGKTGFGGNAEEELFGDHTLPELEPYERYRLMSEASRLPGGAASLDQDSAAGDQLLRKVLHTQGQAQGDRYEAEWLSQPAPSVRDVLGRHDPLSGHIDHLGADAMPMLGATPIDQALPQVESLLARALARHQAMQMGTLDHLALAGGAGGAVGAGYALGQR